MDLLEFHCVNCRSAVRIASREPGSLVICGNCNTRQKVPADASPVLPIASLPYRSNWKGPVHPVIAIIGYIFAIGGPITCGASCIASIVADHNGTVPWMLVFIGGNGVGLMMIGLGAALLCLKDVARHTWMIANRP